MLHAEGTVLSTPADFGELGGNSFDFGAGEHSLHSGRGCSLP